MKRLATREQGHRLGRFRRDDRRLLRSSRRQDWQSEPPERGVEARIVAQAVEAVIDGHERHLIVVLRDRELQILERHVLPAELTADHRQPDRRAAAAGDELLAKRSASSRRPFLQYQMAEQRDEERRAMDQRDAFLLHLDRLVQPALTRERAAQIPVTAGEAGVDRQDLAHLALGFVEAARADQHLAHDERHHHPERIVMAGLGGVVDRLVEASESRTAAARSSRAPGA